jgi:ABC-type transporter Mla MlaB component
MAGEQKEVKTILLTGPITLYEVSAVRESLSMSLAEGKSLRIDLSDAGPWDLAGLQLIVSCVNTARNSDRETRLINVPKPCVEIAERSGLSDWLRSVQD